MFLFVFIPKNLHKKCGRIEIQREVLNLNRAIIMIMMMTMITMITMTIMMMK